ncbi:MAG: hypothetical protein ACREDR_01315 [Blastocatellia bacterium]
MLFGEEEGAFRVRVNLSVVSASELIDLVAEVAEVVRTGGYAKNFIDHRGKVGQGANGGKRRSMLGTEEPTGSSENQRVFDGTQRDASLIEIGGEEAVTTTDGSSGTWSFAVKA